MDQPPDLTRVPHLTPLVCPRCSTPIPAEVNEVAWVCSQCAQGLLLDEDRGLVLLDVQYAAGIPANTPGRPYWVAEGQVILRRQSYSGGKRETSEADAFWSQSQRFFVPAFEISLENLLSDATKLLLNPPALQTGPAVRFHPVTLAAAHVQPTAEFIVLAIEAGRKDKLKKVDFSLQLTVPVLWILP